VNKDITPWVARSAGRVLVGFEAGAGGRGRRAAAVAVDGRVLAGNGRTRVVELDRDADVRAAARRLALDGADVVGRLAAGTFSYVLEATDAAGNTSRSRRHRVRVL
jgi:hypothetical protein